MNALRSLAAVVGGVLVFFAMDWLLEGSIVHVLARGPITDLVAYYGARNQPLGLAAKLIYTPFIGVLAGYTAAKTAARHEIAHTAVGTACLTAELAWGFTKSAIASLTPLWVRIILLLVSPATFMAGGFIRARAAQLQKE